MDAEALEWWRHKCEPDILAESCTKSLKTYAVQFALGGKYTVEIWQELANYAVLDTIETDVKERPGFYTGHMKHLREAHGIVEWGPARLMREWPGASLSIKKKVTKTKAGPYWVGQFKIISGMDAEALKWWCEKCEPDILAEPCTKSLKTYAVQFALGGTYTIEIWQELENYAVLDTIETDVQERPEFYTRHMKHLREAHSIVEWGPARLMREWPGASG
jgi:hypothetical protein